MNKLLQLIVTSLLVSGLSLPLQAAPPLLDLAKTAPEISAMSPVSLSSKDTLRFTLQHRLNGGEPLPIETIEIPLKKFKANPLVFLKVLKQNFSKHSEKRTKPVQIDTKLEFLLPAAANQKLGKLPPLSIKTNIDSDGAGKSDLVFPAFRRVVHQQIGMGKVIIDWKGLNAQFTFTETNQTLVSNIAGLLLENEEKALSASLGNTTISGQFDANWVPTQMDLNLLTLNVRDNSGLNAKLFNLHDLSIKFDSHKTRKNLELAQLNFKVGHLDLSYDDFKSSLDGLALRAYGDEAQGGVINYTLLTQIDRLVFPTPGTFGKIGKTSWVSYVGNLVFRRLDEEALSVLQTTAKQLRHKTVDPTTIGFIMLGKLMEEAPKLLAKSPEIALTQLSVKTPTGNLQGNASVRLDGKKATSLDLAVLRSALLGQVTFSISKRLLKQTLANQIYDSIRKEVAEDKQQLGEDDLAFLKQQAQAASEQQISMFVTLNWLVDRGDGNYEIVADFKNNKLMVNGVVMPLPF
jgi:uncharacterized protein YdgA (DUF945 family)